MADISGRGTPIDGTAGKDQNCAGASCGIKEYINWPYLGSPCPDKNWKDAKAFVPKGCKRVSCEGINTHSTRLPKDFASDLELILFLYRWPVKGGHACDFHMVGRSSCLNLWYSKMDQREWVDNISDPWQSLYDAYPHTKLKDRDIVQLCFRCKKSDMSTK